MDLNSCFRLCLLEKPKIFRVMYKDNFQEWRPHVWQSIKRDYGLGSDVNENDLFKSEDPAIPSNSSSVTNAQLNQALAPLEAPWRR